jgi:putative transposase
VEDVPALARVVDYIHLNPVRAGPEQVANFRWSSLKHFVRGLRPPFLIAEGFLGARNLIASPEGWREYIEQLQILASDPAAQERRGFGEMCRG